MVGLPADAIVDIIFGILNATLTVAMIWQNRNIHREHYRMLGDLLYHGLLLNQFADLGTGDETPPGHAPSFVSEPFKFRADCMLVRDLALLLQWKQIRKRSLSVGPLPESVS